jgi:hypothetical protein
MQTFVPTRTLAKRGFAWLAAALLWLRLTSLAAAQDRVAFEYDPYRVSIWVATDASADVPVSLASELASQLQRDTDQVFDAAWEVQNRVCPASLRTLVATQLEQLGVEPLRAADPELLDYDKLLLVACQARETGGWRVGVRELDCRSRTFGEAVYRDAPQRENLPGAALSALVHAFAPIVRIELVDANKAVTRLRAGGLVTDDSPAAVSEGELLQPVIRRNDRSGEPRAGGIQRLPYTFLEVQKREAHRVECLIHTGVRDAVSGRSGRTERLALRVRPDPRGTRLVLKSLGDDATPLVEYDVLTRAPRKDAELVPLGQSDWQGAIELPSGELPLQFVYVRHGSMTLARVPVVPGLVREQTLSLVNDDLRLLAESYFLAVQNNVMDLVARRELLAARIRLRVEEKDLATAERMLVELRALTSRTELLRQIELQQATYETSDKRLQAKIDKMFAELRKLLTRHLNPRLIDEVTEEVQAAKKA